MLDHTFTIRVNLIFSIFMLALSTTFVCAMDIFQAAQQGDLATMQSLIQNDRNLAEAKDNHGWTPLHFASDNGHLSVVQYLTGLGHVDCNAKINTGATALHIASENGHLTVVQHLTRLGHVDCNVKDNAYWTPLHFACQNGHLPIAQYLIEQCKADYNAKTNDDSTALHIASDNNHLTVVQYLTRLDHVDCNAKTKDGWTPLHSACYFGDLPVVQHLTGLDHVDCNAKNNDGLTPLHFACQCNSLPMIQYLIEQCKADYNAKDNDDLTALHIASYNNHLTVVQYLTGLGHVDCNAKTKDGCTPLHFACQYDGNFDIVRFLLYNGANKESTNNALESPAALTRNYKIMQFLNNFSLTSPHSFRLLDAACVPSPNTMPGMKNAITQGADVDVYGLYGNTPLHFATQAGNWQAVLYLLLHGANPTLTNNHQQNPLQVAIQHSQWRTFTIFLIAATATKDPAGNDIPDRQIRKNAQQCHTIVNEFFARELPTFGEPARKRRRIND
jgi:ankyrin repeat domain-containing protein 50